MLRLPENKGASQWWKHRGLLYSATGRKRRSTPHLRLLPLDNGQGIDLLLHPHPIVYLATMAIDRFMNAWRPNTVTLCKRALSRMKRYLGLTAGIIKRVVTPVLLHLHHIFKRRSINYFNSTSIATNDHTLLLMGVLLPWNNTLFLVIVSLGNTQSAFRRWG